MQVHRFTKESAGQHKHYATLTAKTAKHVRIFQRHAISATLAGAGWYHHANDTTE